jgi:exosortase family protein XrtF
VRAFRPAILFLVKFFLIFFLGTGAYGWYVKQSQPHVDGMTRLVTYQLVYLLELKEPGIQIKERLNTFQKQMTLSEPWQGVGAALSLYTAGREPIVSVFEGCNGLAIMILYLAFLVAFGGPLKPMIAFIFGGLAFIHLVNLLRIFGLSIISLDIPEWLFFTHKYLFTAVIYLAILGIWYVWVSRFAFSKHAKADS